MAKSALYTATGDQGTTSLVGGQRVGKDSLRLESYGTIDELSSFIGLAAANPACTEELRGQLIDIQNVLFDLGTCLATPPDSKYQPKPIEVADVTKLEGWIDTLDEQTPKVNTFVLPGGCSLAATLHVARTICRRGERIIVALAKTETIGSALMKYVNRLSDYLFIAARYSNFISDTPEICWRPERKE